jgi:hypothetical protein
MDERTIEILKRFDNSWIETELKYDNLIIDITGFDHLIPLRQFIYQLRQAGEDKYFRLGTSMHSLIFSRSVDFGLRTDQKYIKIEAIGINDFEVIFRDGVKTYREYRINNLNDPKLTKLLRTLKSTLVD